MTIQNEKNLDGINTALLQSASTLIQEDSRSLRQVSQEFDQTAKATEEFVQKVLVRALKSQNKAKQELLALETELEKQIIFLQEQISDLQMAAEKESDLRAKAFEVKVTALGLEHSRLTNERNKWQHWHKWRSKHNSGALQRYAYDLFIKVKLDKDKAIEEGRDTSIHDQFLKNYSIEIKKLDGRE